MSQDNLILSMLPSELPQNNKSTSIANENFVLFDPQRKQYIYVDLRNGADWPYFTDKIAKAEIFPTFHQAASYKRRYIKHYWDKDNSWNAEIWEIWKIEITQTVQMK